MMSVVQNSQSQTGLRDSISVNRSKYRPSTKSRHIGNRRIGNSQWYTVPSLVVVLYLYCVLLLQPYQCRMKHDFVRFCHVPLSNISYQRSGPRRSTWSQMVWPRPCRSFPSRLSCHVHAVVQVPGQHSSKVQRTGWTTWTVKGANRDHLKWSEVRWLKSFCVRYRYRRQHRDLQMRYRKWTRAICGWEGEGVQQISELHLGWNADDDAVSFIWHMTYSYDIWNNCVLYRYGIKNDIIILQPIHYILHTINYIYMYYIHI